MSDYVSLIAIAGIFGIVNYWIFRAMNLLDFFDHNEADEKNILIVGLGLINFVVSDLLRYLTEDEFQLGIYILASMAFAFIIECLILFLIKCISERVRKHFFEDKKSMSFYKPVIQILLEDYIGSDEKIYVYIYDFNNNIIEHGRLNFYAPDENEESSIAIELDPGTASVATEFEEVRQYFPIDSSMNVYINFEWKYKLYLVIEEKEEDS